MKNQAIRELRAEHRRTLDLYREQYEQLVAKGMHGEAAVIKGQISRQCGKLDGIDLVLEEI